MQANRQTSGTSSWPPSHPTYERREVPHRGGTSSRDEEQLFGEVTSSGIHFDSYADVAVTATPPPGATATPPITGSYSDVTFPSWLAANIERCKYTKPTPIQSHTLPAAAAGHDIMACAQTGSGKTAAFLLPVLTAIDQTVTTIAPSWGRGAPGIPKALILAPTRELAEQIHKDAARFTYRSKVKCVAVYGGEGTMGGQLRELERGVDLLVACPGRLHDLIERGRVQLRDVQFLVLDEADRMLDMGFEPQIRDIVERADMPGGDSRQTLMFSATFPGAMQRMARDFLRAGSTFHLEVGRVGATGDNIEQDFVFLEDSDKRSTLLDLIHGNNSADSHGLTVVFVETKRLADILEYDLVDQGVPAVSIHGDKAQQERRSALAAFKAGEARVLVATDVAARGLDVAGVTHVINCDLPKDVDSYVHRIGRTGRAGRAGRATSLMTPRDARLAPELVELLGAANRDIPPELLKMAARAPSRPSKPHHEPRPATGGMFNTTDHRKGGAQPTLTRPAEEVLSMAEYEAASNAALMEATAARRNPSAASSAGKKGKKGKKGSTEDLISWDDAMGAVPLDSGVTVVDTWDMELDTGEGDEAPVVGTPDTIAPPDVSVADATEAAVAERAQNTVTKLLASAMDGCADACTAARKVQIPCADTAAEAALVTALTEGLAGWEGGDGSFLAIVKEWYDRDVVSEDGILLWWQTHSPRATHGALVEQLRPLVTWLQEAEEEDSDGE